MGMERHRCSCSENQGTDVQFIASRERAYSCVIHLHIKGQGGKGINLISGGGK